MKVLIAGDRSSIANNGESNYEYPENNEIGRKGPISAGFRGGAKVGDLAGSTAFGADTHAALVPIMVTKYLTAMDGEFGSAGDDDMETRGLLAGRAFKVVFVS